jgi:putative colanic acid biosynthesis acetyltransferase WcaF
MLEIEKNRRATKYSRQEMLQRMYWGVGAKLFRAIPRPLFGLRNWLLRRYGSTIGQQVRITNTAIIQYPWLLSIKDYSAIGEHAIIYNLGPIRIGSRVTVSQYAHLCGGTHDHTSPGLELIRSPISLDDDAWIAADAFVGPNVNVGKGAIVGARAVVVKDVAPWTIVAGNPARVIGERKIHSDRHGD